MLRYITLRCDMLFAMLCYAILGNFYVYRSCKYVMLICYVNMRCWSVMLICDFTCDVNIWCYYVMFGYLILCYVMYCSVMLCIHAIVSYPAEIWLFSSFLQDRPSPGRGVCCRTNPSWSIPPFPSGRCWGVFILQSSFKSMESLKHFAYISRWIPKSYAI